MKATPNIILIILDCVRADHLSCYGYHRETSPHIDRIAEGGTLFNYAISASPWTLPSHASLFTGAYVSRHRTDIDNRYLDESFVTMADILRRKGFKTMALSSNVWVSTVTGLGRGFDEFYRVNNPPYEDIKDKNVFHKAADHLYWKYYYERRYDYGARRINKILKRRIGRLNGSSPFFVFINYLEAHLKYDPPRKYRHLFLKKSEDRYVSQDKFAYFTGDNDLGEEDFHILRALYDAEIRYLDDRIGQLVEMLSGQGILDDTMIIITSDHGENIGDHGLMDHQYSVHESLIRVPLIIRCPGVFPVSHIIDEQVQTIDILSTLCDLFRVNGAEVESQLQGVSLLSSGPRERKAVFAEYLRPNLIQLRRRYPNHDVTKYDVAYRTVRTGDYKYIESSSGGVELYRIDEDPGETRNLSSAEQGRVREMQGVLEEWAKTARHDSERGSKRDDSRYDERTMRMLKDMGYM